jgi:hypothetical protein
MLTLLHCPLFLSRSQYRPLVDAYIKSVFDDSYAHNPLVRLVKISTPLLCEILTNFYALDRLDIPKYNLILCFAYGQAGEMLQVASKAPDNKLVNLTKVRRH